MGKRDERKIQLALHSRFNSQYVFAAPNYTPRNWWECDMWALLRSGYVIEYEIKLSMSDFHADKKKKMQFRTRETGYFMANKHDLLEQRSVYCPNRFMFCVPTEIADKVLSVLPSWAGLLVFSDLDPRRFNQINKVKPAPLLHKNKCSDEEMRKCVACITNRYWPMLREHERQLAERAL